MKSCVVYGLALVLYLFFAAEINLLSAEVYEVGEGKKYLNISDVPLESIKAGDKVLIYYRKEPYKEKWVITATGTKENPVIFSGVPDANGNLPVIDGRDAVTRKGLNFWSEVRGIIKIGGSNNPPDTLPAYVIIENLEIVNAHTPYTFTGRNGLTSYENNSAAVFVEKGENITIRNCIIHNNGNGIFVAYQAKNVLIESNNIYGNGNAGSIYEHNTYTESDGIIYQFNRFGPLIGGAGGNNLKDRSAGTIIRYNFIESGNRQLDLVDSSHQELLEREYYHKTYVYGNILVEPDGAGNSQIVHYGGDSGNTDNYRKGVLYFYNNTVISSRSGNTTLVRLSSPEEEAYIINNIIYATAGGSRLAVLESDGKAHLISNWMNSGYRKSHSNPDAIVLDEGGNISSPDPQFIDFGNNDFHLAVGSECIDKGSDLGKYSLSSPEYQFTEDRAGKMRFKDGVLDMGAFEFVKQIADAGIDTVDVTDTLSQDTDLYDSVIGEDTALSDISSDISNDFCENSCDSENIDGITAADTFQSDSLQYDIAKTDIADSGYGERASADSGCSCVLIE